MMAGNVQELPPKGSGSEKITVNLGYIELGYIELLIRESLYTNRTDAAGRAVLEQWVIHGAGHA
jgi:hypothetical protein